MISDLLAKLPPLTVLRMAIVDVTDPGLVFPPGVEITGERALGVGQESWDSLRVRCLDPGYRHALGMVSRPGMMYFTRHLELTYFPPADKARNDLYDQRFFKWDDLIFSLVTVPVEFDALLHETAKATRMRLVSQALPIVIDSKGAVQMPLPADYVYSVENTEGHTIYTQGHKAAAEQQDRDIAALESRHFGEE